MLTDEDEIKVRNLLRRAIDYRDWDAVEDAAKICGVTRFSTRFVYPEGMKCGTGKPRLSDEALNQSVNDASQRWAYGPNKDAPRG